MIRGSLTSRSTAGVLASAWALACASSSEPGGQSAATIDNPPVACAESGSERRHAPLRRLTRFEYSRTLADLTGVDTSISNDLPADEKSLGFDNQADTYSVSSLHAAKYLELAERAADSLAADGQRMAGFAGCDPLSDASCVEPFVRAFGRRAFRRALTTEELASFLSLHAVLAAESARDALTAVVSALLQSPQFLYRPEPATSAPQDFGAALATRLSYLIVGTAPDEELLDAAESGGLATASGLLAQAERLLASPRAVEAFTHFVEQWWAIDDLSSLDKDRRLFRAWDDDIPGALSAETRAFVGAAWRAGPTLHEFFASNVTYVDAKLAAFYGLNAPGGDGFRRVELDARHAAGLLTQGSFLAAHAKPDQTSPIHRGKFVRERLFCTPPDPPPPDVVVRPPVVDPRLRTRERFAQHTTDPSCAGCHALMDPIGFAFENYDAVGRHRDTENGEPIDASGELTDTDVDGVLDGVPSLAARLLESEQVQSCVARQWFRYAFGRRESTAGADSCALAALTAELAQSGDFRAVLRKTVEQELFREPRGTEDSR